MMIRRDVAWLPLSMMLLAAHQGCSFEEAQGDPPSPTATPNAPSSEAGAEDSASPDVTACAPKRVSADTVATSTGTFTGAKSGDAWAWKGIRYAQAPTADLRWKPPVAASCSTETKPATDYGAICPQVNDGAIVGNEDCLSLNVWAPEGLTDAPVLFFVHGGGNTKGTGSDPIYDGAQLAASTRSVVVTINYRIGALGFLTHPKLDDERAEHVSGNYGVLDQILALSWVKKNIASFGGAPSKVLLFGESAGGQNTLVHIGSPLSAGLFRAAIVESGGIYTTTLADAKANHAKVVEDVGCATATDAIACLRAVPIEKLLAIETADGPLERTGVRFGPVVDGYVQKGTALEAMEGSTHNHVPVVIGTNADETSRMVPKVTTDVEYEAAVEKLYGPATKALIAQYPSSRFGSPQRALVRLTTDVVWTCPARRIARAAAAHQTEPVYRYYFTWRAPGPAGAVVGATHGLELPFVFGTFTALSASFQPTAADSELSRAMGSFWSQLAANGEPGSVGAATFPRYDVTRDDYLELGTPIAAKGGLATADCEVIDALVKQAQGSP
jgi:para-nitrobenzyl esterase